MTTAEYIAKIDEILNGMESFGDVVEGLSSDQLQDLQNNPTTAFGGEPYKKAFELMKNFQKYTSGALPSEVTAYLFSKKDDIEQKLLGFGTVLRQSFGADIYTQQMAPVLGSLDEFGTYFSASDEPVPETDPEAAASAPIPTTQVSPPAPEAAAAGAASGAASGAAVAASEPRAETGSSPSSNEPQKVAQTTEDDVFSKYMVGPYNPSSSMDRDKMAIVKDMMVDYEKKFGKPFDINNPDDLRKMQPIANAAYSSKEYKQAARRGPIPYKPKRPVNKPEPKGSTLYKTREGGILGIGAKDKYSPNMPEVGTKKYQAIDTKTGKVTQVRRAKPVKTINTPKPGALRGKNK